MKIFAKKFLEYTLIFFIGAVIYSLIEIVYRGYTHWTMAVTGGICLIFIRFESRLLYSLGILARAFIGAVGITVIELIVGYIVNIRLGLNIWDYSSLWLNFYGQICLVYSLAWFLISFPAIILCDRISSVLNTQLKVEITE